jgi:hypothetical protein
MRLSTAVTIGDTFPEMFISVYVKRFTWARHAFELVSGCKSAQWRHPSMHGSFDRSGKSNNRIDRGWGIGFLALPATLVIALVGLAMIQPAAPAWISAAVQAEFVGPDVGPDVRPTQLAQPGMVVTGTVKAN